MRAAVFVDVVYRRDDEGVSADQPVLRFVVALRRHLDLTLVGRLDPTPGRFPYALPPDVEFEPLPHYASAWSAGEVLNSAPGALRAWRRAVARAEIAWILGPNPLAVPFALLAAVLRRRVVLGVRQDYPRYVRHRGSGGVVGVAAAHALDGAFRLLARRFPVVAVGADLAARYRRSGASVLEATISLVAPEDVGTSAQPAEIAPSEPVRLLWVGRLDREKAPELLLPMLESLQARRERLWQLTVVGDGPLRRSLEAEAGHFGDAVLFRGHIPYGRALLDLYCSSHVLVHTARTEGWPQVLVEAQAVGLPAVATEVGGVRDGVGPDGALLVEPGDAAALARAVAALADDPALRRRLREQGVRRAATIDREAARVAAFLLEQPGPAP